MDDSADWIPPENPEPIEILHEAAGDTIAGRYSNALAKHIWFHENALRLRPSLSGVRRSFALGYWHRLAAEYPPAMDALRKARDTAESQFLQQGFGFSAFHDLASLNRELDERGRTVEAFKVADRADPNAASLNFHVALPSLVVQQEYALCGRYLAPEKQLELAIEIFKLQRKFESERAGSEPQPPDTSRTFFVQEVATLVALLVKNNRLDEARSICNQAQAELNDEEFKDDLTSALDGNVPKPWP